jgi:hypothetical protein
MSPKPIDQDVNTIWKEYRPYGMIRRTCQRDSETRRSGCRPAELLQQGSMSLADLATTEGSNS